MPTIYGKHVLYLELSGLVLAQQTARLYLIFIVYFNVKLERSNCTNRVAVGFDNERVVPFRPVRRNAG